MDGLKKKTKNKNSVTPLLTHWSYVFLTLTHRYTLAWNRHQLTKVMLTRQRLVSKKNIKWHILCAIITQRHEHHYIYFLERKWWYVDSISLKMFGKGPIHIGQFSIGLRDGLLPNMHQATTWAQFLSFARSKLRLCSANHRPGYWSNLSCDWPSTAWAYAEQETENGPWTKGPIQIGQFSIDLSWWFGVRHAPSHHLNQS